MSKDMVSAMITVDNRALKTSSGHIGRLIHEKLMRLIVDQIVEEHTMKEVGDFSTTFRITLVVKSPDEYYRDVHKAAMDISVGYPQFIEEPK